MNKTLEKTIVGDITPINKNVLWIDSNNNQIKYNNHGKWVSLSSKSGVDIESINLILETIING